MSMEDLTRALGVAQPAPQTQLAELKTAQANGFLIVYSKLLELEALLLASLTPDKKIIPFPQKGS